MTKNQKYLAAYIAIFAALGIAILITDKFFFPHNDSYREAEAQKGVEHIQNRRAAQEIIQNQ